MQAERDKLAADLERLMTEWEEIEATLEQSWNFGFRIRNSEFPESPHSELRVLMAAIPRARRCLDNAGCRTTCGGAATANMQDDTARMSRVSREQIRR